VERAELIKLRIKALLNETAVSNPEHTKKRRWREAALAAVLILQAVALIAIVNAREPLYVGTDPYGNHVVADPGRPLVGKLYGNMSYEPGTKVIPAQDELTERTALEFRF